MTLTEKLREVLESMNEKQFFTYVAAATGLFILFIMASLFFFYRSNSYLYGEIKKLNMERKGDIRKLLIKAEHIQQQKKEVQDLIQQDPGFLLNQFLDTTLNTAHLTEKKEVTGRLITQDLPDESLSEQRLEVTLNTINMRELVEFLALIEDNKRVYIKKLDIAKSKTTPNTLEVVIGLATLIPKTT